MNAEITRPLLRYHGGKYMLAPWIISHFPSHRVYTETFGGAASVLLRKDRSYAELYNDLDGEIVNLFTITRTRGKALIKALRYTSFSRYEFELSYHPCKNKFEQARRTIVRSFLGFGSGAASGRATGFRFNSNRSGTTPAHDWKNFPDALDAIIARLQGVVIENRDAMIAAKSVDGPDTLHFFDPPYHLDTLHLGQRTQVYRHEMKNEEHVKFLQKALLLDGMCIICGYANDIYNEMLCDWKKEYKEVLADGAKWRTEVLYISPSCHAAWQSEVNQSVTVSPQQLLF